MNSDPRGLRTDGSRGDTKGYGIAQRYYQTSIVAGCDAPYGKYELQFGEFDRLDMGIDEASNWTSGRYMWYCPEMYSNDLTQDPCVRMRFRLDCSSSNGKQDGEDKVQYSEIDHLAMVPAKAHIRMHLGQSGQSGQYGENHEPRLKTSERPDLHAGSAPCTDPWTAVYQLAHGLVDPKSRGKPV
ncbi:BnaAnng16700D [Brassica napus]|uniref:BnaAnng16700D protein n=1 Tax=Brassica napus TaxID=3708 RepID=A0A078J929_BRANA|nr:BnaAnng16700D [Brassica napus]